MNKMIPRGKLSKKARKALDTRHRVTWSFSPVTRKPPSPAAYSRKKFRFPDDGGIAGTFFMETSFPHYRYSDPERGGYPGDKR